MFEVNQHSSHSEPVKTLPPTLSPEGLRTALRAFCERHPIRRLDVFGSAARGQASPRSDVDLLVTLDDSVPVSTLEILEMAGEADSKVLHHTRARVRDGMPPRDYVPSHPAT